MLNESQQMSIEHLTQNGIVENIFAELSPPAGILNLEGSLTSDSLVIDDPICQEVYLPNDLELSFIDSCIEDVEEIQHKISGSDIDIVPKLDPFCVKESISNGMYSRMLLMPKGMMIIGGIHKNHYIDMMVGGDITDTGYLVDGTKEETKRLKGINYFNGIPGRKRVGFTHEDTLWITVDKTDRTNSKDAFADVIFVNAEDYLKYKEAELCQAG